MTSLFQPSRYDFFHLLAFQRLMGEKVIDDGSQRSPVIFSIEQSIEPGRCFLHVVEPLAFIWK